MGAEAPNWYELLVTLQKQRSFLQTLPTLFRFTSS